MRWLTVPGCSPHGGQARWQELEVDCYIVSIQEAQKMNTGTSLTLSFESSQRQHPGLVPPTGEVEFLPQLT